MAAPKHIYVIKNLEIDRIKIGISSEPRTRLMQIENSAGCKMEMVYCSDPCFNSKYIEKKIHGKLKNDRYIGEWFNLGVEYAVKVATDIIDSNIVTEKIDSQNINIGSFKRLKNGIYEKNGNLYNVSYLDGKWNVIRIE